MMCRMYVDFYLLMMFLQYSFDIAFCDDDDDYTRMPLWAWHWMSIEARDATGAMTAVDVVSSSSWKLHSFQNDNTEMMRLEIFDT